MWLIQLEVEEFNMSKEKIKWFVKEMVYKLNPEYEGSFSLMKMIMDDKPSKIQELMHCKTCIRFEPPYPLQIIFTADVLFKYNQIFLFFIQVERARASVVSKL